MEITREGGFYWINVKGYGWIIGLYTDIDKEWSVCHGNIRYYDKHVLEIDESRIMRDTERYRLEEDNALLETYMQGFNDELKKGRRSV